MSLCHPRALVGDNKLLSELMTILMDLVDISRHQLTSPKSELDIDDLISSIV
jgi:hypothetical protein